MMRRATVLLAVLALAAISYAATALFNAPAESKWTVTSGGKQVATITLLTDGRSVRAEWKGNSGPATVFLGANEKTWVRSEGGDIELSSYKSGVDRSVAPALLLPYTTTPTDRIATEKGKPSSYSFLTSKATYAWDKSGVASVQVSTGGSAYTLSRQSVGKLSSNDASLFAVRPKKRAASTIASAAGNLFGTSNTNVSATAGGRGVSGFKLADGGDYAAVDKILTRDDEAKDKLPDALEKFQEEGKVGRAQGGHE